MSRWCGERGAFVPQFIALLRSSLTNDDALIKRRTGRAAVMSGDDDCTLSFLGNRSSLSVTKEILSDDESFEVLISLEIPLNSQCSVWKSLSVDVWGNLVCVHSSQSVEVETDKRLTSLLILLLRLVHFLAKPHPSCSETEPWCSARLTNNFHWFLVSLRN